MERFVCWALQRYAIFEFQVAQATEDLKTENLSGMPRQPRMNPAVVQALVFIPFKEQ